MRSELFSGAIWIKADATSLRTQLLGGATLKRTFIRNRRRFLTEAGTFRKQLRAAAMSSALILSLLSGADANPTGAEIRAGQAHIAPGVNTEIQQLTDKAIIDWQSFSIGNGESVRFFQPGTQSVILNRVVGADPSQILGTLTANGNVFLINTNGILFGPNSVVSVGGLVASSLNISDDDFLQGNYTFTLKEGLPLAAIINQGTIKVSDAGYAVLTGPTVINEGLIVARTGKIVLGATERTTLNLDGRDLVHYAIGSERNEGATLLSHGDVSQALLDTLGVAPNRRADQLIRNADGSVVLKNSSGTLVQAGTVDTDGVGGANGGKIWLDSSDLTLLAKGSTTTASASEGNASGGEIYVLSRMDGNQTIQGFSDVQAESLLAASGSGSGDGGFIEVSGDGLNLLGEIDLSSESGVAGSFLLDPVDIVIIDGDNAPTTVANPLIFDDFTNNMSTLIGAQWFRTQPFSTLAVESSGNITVDMQLEGNNPLNNNTVDFRRGGSATTITLEAGTDPGVVGNINLGNNGTTYTGLNSFALIADGNIQLGDSIISTGGSFSATAGTGITGGTGSATTGSGNITLQATTGDIVLQDYNLTVNSAAANLDVSQELFIRTPAGSVDLGRGSLRAQGSIQITANGGVNLSNNSLDSDLRRVISVDAGGDIDLTNARLNQNLAGLASGIDISTTNGGIDLNGSQISVGQDANDNFDLTATGLINFGSSVINVLVSNPTDGVSITTAGAIDLGTADLTFDSNFGAAPLNTLLRAGTGISGQTGSIDVDGDLTLETTTGSIALQNFDIDVRSSASNLDVSNELFLRAPGGSIDLGTGSANVVGSIQLNASGNVDLSDNTLDSNLRRIISVNSGGDINLTNALINQNLGTGASGINFTTTNGGIDLNGSQISVGQDANDNFDLTATGLINFGSSVINVLVSNPTDGVSITTAGAIDLGTADLTFDSNFGAAPLNTLLRAGTGISGQTGSIDVDGDLTLETTTGSIALQNFDIDVRSSASNLDVSNELFLRAPGGSIDLGTGSANVVGSIQLNASGNVDLSDNTLDSNLRRIISVNSGGDINLTNALINQNLGTGASGINFTTTNGGIDLNGSQISVGQDANDNFDLTATGLINFGSSVINVLVSNPTDGVSITTTGSIDLGTATINLDSNFGAIPLNTLIMAGTGISGQTGVINVDGGLTLETTTGDISLQNFDIDVRSSASNLNISNELFVTSRAGSIDLGASVVDVVGSINLRSSNNIDLGSGTLSIVTLNRDFQAFAGGTIDAASVQVTVPNRFSLGANGGVQANGSRIDAPDLEIFGFDPLATTPALDPARAVAGPVRLDLSRTGNIDISLLAEGDIEINHTGGTLTTERAGLEGSGGSASPSSIRSTTGSITIVSDGELRLGKGGGDAGEAFVKADATNAQVSLTADTITDVSNAAPIDVSSGGQLVLKGTTQVAGTTNGLEVSGRGIVLDLSAGTANEGGVNIIGNSEYLKVLANRSNVNVVETVNTGANQLRISDVAGKDELRLDPLGIATVHVVDSADIALGPISVTDGQTLAIQAINGSNITEGGTGPGNLDSAGNLLLTAEGSIGTPTESVLIPGGVVAAQAGSDAGDQLFIESRDVGLSLDTVTVTDALGNTQATASGLSAGGDIVAKVSGTNPANLFQNGNIASNSGSVILAVESGNLEQTTGNTIKGASLGLKVSEDVGTFDGNTATPVNIDAGEVALAVGGDVILDRATGDVNLVNQVTAAGETVTSTGAGGDLRVQAQNGNIRLNTDLTSGGETALVSGTNLTVNAQTLPNSVFLNGNLNATQSLVVVSSGDVIYQSGTLTSPNIGIGAAGSIGTTTEPVQIQTDNLALNPAGGQVNDPDGFTTVNSVSAAGATVNQGTTNTNDNGGGGGTTGGTTVTVTVVLDPSNVGSGVFLNDGELPQALAQNNVDMVEEVLTDLLGQPTGFNYQEADPTRSPNKGWFNDEDLLKRKFRR